MIAAKIPHVPSIRTSAYSAIFASRTNAEGYTLGYSMKVTNMMNITAPAYKNTNLN